jgi:hypothetical protein
MEHELILEPECHDLTRLHPSTRWRLEREGKFPRSFKIGDPDAQNGRAPRPYWPVPLTHFTSLVTIKPFADRLGPLIVGKCQHHRHSGSVPGVGG